MHARIATKVRLIEHTGTLRVTFEIALGYRNALTAELPSSEAWERHAGTWIGAPKKIF